MQILNVSGHTLATVGIVVVFLLIAVVFFGFAGLKDLVPYLKENKSVRRGIVLAVGVFLLFVFTTTKCSALDLEMDLGVQDTFKDASPQCTPEGNISETLTSNIAFRAKMFQFDRVEMLMMRTHHSCVFNQDRNTFDASEMVLRLPVTPNFSLLVSYGYNEDLKSYLTRREISYYFLGSFDSKTRIGFTVTQIAFDDRALESEHGYLAAGVTVNYRVNIFGGK